jgi:hypothetical protein
MKQCTDNTRKKIITNNGGGFTFKIVADFVNKNFIKHGLTIPDHLQTNGVTNRFNHIIFNCMRAMLCVTGLGHSFWVKVGVALTCIHNRTPICKGMSPTHRITLREPVIHHLKTLGYRVLSWIQNETDRMEIRESPLILVVYNSK